MSYAWTELHTRFGRLPFTRVFEPAIAHGRNGFLVSPTVAGQWAGQARELRSQPGFAEEFLPGGRAPAPGERFRLPEHAATLETIAATGGEAFYRGELAAAMEAHSTANGGAMLASGDGRPPVSSADPRPQKGSNGTTAVRSTMTATNTAVNARSMETEPNRTGFSTRRTGPSTGSVMPWVIRRAW
jgi:hypothetical protein